MFRKKYDIILLTFNSYVYSCSNWNNLSSSKGRFKDRNISLSLQQKILNYLIVSYGKNYKNLHKLLWKLLKKIAFA